MIVGPITLEGRVVRLEPLDERHIPDLAVAGVDESTWRYMPYGQVVTVDRMATFVRQTIAKHADGTEAPFAVVLRATGRAVGMTRYLDIRPAHRGLEIGGTWYAPEHRRTVLNTECKLLLLTHAFDTLDAIRVQLKTDERNAASRRAIERIGATFEGILRENMILADGVRRSTAYYSILSREWPSVKDRLERLAVARDEAS